jgi:hypothetical protein
MGGNGRIIGQLAALNQQMDTGGDKTFGGRLGGEEGIASDGASGRFIGHASPRIDNTLAIEISRHLETDFDAGVGEFVDGLLDTLVEFDFQWKSPYQQDK